MNPLPFLLLVPWTGAAKLSTARAPVVVAGPSTTAAERFGWAMQAAERAVAGSTRRLLIAVITTPEIYADLLKLPYEREELIDIGTSPSSRMRGWVILKKNFWQHHLRSLELDASVDGASAGQAVAVSLRRAKLIQAVRAIVADIEADETFLRQEHTDETRHAMIERKRLLFERLEEMKR